MDNLKIKLRYSRDGFELEIDGDKALVQEEWNKIKKDGLGNILGGVDIPHTLDIKPDHIGEITPKALSQNGDTAYPEIMNLVYKGLPSSESEWILVYCLYSKDFKTLPLNSNSIIEMYEKTKRKTESNVKNLKNNLKSLLNQGLINFINNDDFVITDTGISKVKEIVGRAKGKPTTKGSTNGKAQEKNKGNEKSKKTESDSVKLDNNLNLRPNGKESLIAFNSKFQDPSVKESFLIFVYYLEKILGQTSIGLDQIYTCFKETNVRPPNFFRQTVTNIKNEKGWINSSDMNNLKLTQRGTNHIEFDIKKSNGAAK